MIKFKEFDVGDNNYEEQLEQFQTEHPTAEFVQITGGYTSYEKIWFKYEPSNISDSTDKLSVEKLEPIGYYNEAHGFLHDEFDKDCYCQGGCSMEAVYTESQVKRLTGENKVEKLQEHLLPYKKETVQKIRDEKMQLVTADEFLKLHKESLTAIRENDKLQEQLNTAKKALTEIQQLKRRDTTNLGMINKLQTIAKDTLAAIGNEGSGDE